MFLVGKDGDTRLPPRALSQIIFWNAAELSRQMTLLRKVVYVWVENGRYVFGTEKPLNKFTVATFYKERLTYCIWGDAQHEDELMAEINEHDRAQQREKWKQIRSKM